MNIGEIGEIYIFLVQLDIIWIVIVLIVLNRHSGLILGLIAIEVVTKTLQEGETDTILMRIEIIKSWSQLVVRQTQVCS